MKGTTIFVLTLVAAGFAHADERAIAVLPLKTTTVNAARVTALDNFLLTEIARNEKLRVITPSDINAILGMEKMRDAVGCDDVTCASELGGALGVDYLFTGTADAIGGRILITATLLDIRQASAVVRKQVQRQNDEALYLDAVAELVKQVFTTCRIVVTTSPPGSQIFINGESAGTAPLTLEGRQPGDYEIRAQLDGYVDKTTNRTVNEGQDLVVQLNLTTLEESLSTEQRRASKVMWMWISGGASITLAAGATVLFATKGDPWARYNGGEYPDVDATFSSHDSMVIAGWTMMGMAAASATFFLYEWVTMPESDAGALTVLPVVTGEATSLVILGRFP